MLSVEQRKKAVDRARRWALANPEKVKANYLKALAKRRKGRRPPSTERAERATCTRCETEKPAAEFGTAPFHLKRNGLRSWCMTCEGELNTEWRKTNRRKWLDRVATYRSEHREQERVKSKRYFDKLSPEEKRDRVKKHTLKHPEKVAARQAVARALKNGTLIKPETCSKCGALERIQSHHKNYKSPLKVTWLCQPCHKVLHRADKRKVG